MGTPTGTHGDALQLPGLVVGVRIVRQGNEAQEVKVLRGWSTGQGFGRVVQPKLDFLSCVKRKTYYSEVFRITEVSLFVNL